MIHALINTVIRKGQHTYSWLSKRAGNDEPGPEEPWSVESMREPEFASEEGKTD